MRDEACKFWDLWNQRENYCLVLPNMHDIMSLNKEPSHIAHTLAKYFEIHRAKRAVLHLIRPDKMRDEILQEERGFIKIKGAQKTMRFAGEDKRTFDEIKAERDRKNLAEFFRKYPDLEEVKIDDMTQFDQDATDRANIANPDMSFCNFIISFSMLILSMWTFYSHRDLNNEYFNRQLIYQKLLNNPDENALQFNEISTVDDLENFIKTTVATQIFEPS